MRKIFIIDDDPVHHRIMQIYIEKSNAFESCTDFYSADEAYDYLAANKDKQENLPDYILLDLHMPVTNGLDFLHMYEGIYTSLCKNIDIYVVSSSLDQSDRNNSLVYPFVKDFIRKPSYSELFSKLSA